MVFIINLLLYTLRILYNKLLTELSFEILEQIYDIMRSGRSQGQAVLPFFYLAPYWGYFILPHVVFDDVSPRTWKAQKELLERRQWQIGDEDVLFYFSFISWVQQPFIGWGNFPWI